jgi:hypothetical protein
MNWGTVSAGTDKFTVMTSAARTMLATGVMSLMKLKVRFS